MTTRGLRLPLSCLALAGLSGCGSGGGKATPTPPKPATARASATLTPPVVVTQQPTLGPSATAALSATPSPTPVKTATTRPISPTVAPAARTPAQLLSVSVHPAVVAPGGLLTLGVSTTGQVRAVQMSIGSGLPTAPPPIAYKLSLVSNGTWRGSGDAPSVPGEYHYSVALFAEDGRRLLRDNDAWNIQVGNTQPTVAPAAQSVPPELLAPPFFYGNPTPVVFSAAGRSVSGSEVVSNSRPDVAPATVAGYYSTHLPRAGWTVSGSQLPGSTSFTISASSGQRVCVIQYGASTIHVFFGVLGG